MNHINGGNSPKFEKTGTYTFDGNQAVAYSRIRYMEGGDHARANHQRLVLEGIMNTAKKQPLKLGKLISTVLPQCKTSLSNDALTKLTLSMARCKIEDSQAYPFKSEDVHQCSMLYAVQELFMAAKTVGGNYYKYFESYLVIAVIYFVLCFVFDKLFKLIEKKLQGKTDYALAVEYMDNE